MADSSNTIRGPECENCGVGSREVAPRHGPVVCARCQRTHWLISAVHTAIMLALTVLALWVAMPHLIANAGAVETLDRPPGYLPGVALLAFYVWLVIGMVVHEGAHAARAKAAGFPVTEIQLGSGRVVAQRRVRGTLVSLHAVPFGGRTSWKPDTRGVLLPQRAAIASAGPLANLALGLLLLALRTHAPDLTVAGACANLLMFVGNALPRPPSQNSPVANDGWQILKCLTKSRWARGQARRSRLQAGVIALVGAGRTSEVASYLRSAIDASGGDDPDAEAFLAMFLLAPTRTKAEITEGFARSQRLLCDARAHPIWRAGALSNRAYLIAAGGWPHLMPEAEALVREALRWRPNDPSISGSLALVLVRVGRYAEAEALLTEVIEKRLGVMQTVTGQALEGHKRSLAANRATRALLHAHAGRVDAARAEFALARSLDPQCLLLDELDRLLGAQTGTGVAAA